MIKEVVNECCPDCGNDLLSDFEEEDYKEGFVYDGQSVWCVDCDFKSYFSVHEDGCLIADPL